MTRRRALYADREPYVAAWLRNLVAAGALPPGDVDDRDINDLTGGDVDGYEQVHLFAGIGGWPLALRMAGWPAGREVWTGSCPCQPFSCAGKRKGTDDERHLWPAFQRLIAECRPATVFGEQVASRDGREWLAGVRADLQELGYAVGCADLPAASVGAPHKRQRLWWVADAIGGDGRAGIAARNVGDGQDAGRAQADGEPATCGKDRGMDDADGARPQGCRLHTGEHPDQRPTRQASPWDNAVWLPCSDGKARRTQPGIHPLAHGVPCRVGRIRAYGNAIVPQVAAAFVRAFLDCEGDVT